MRPVTCGRPRAAGHAQRYGLRVPAPSLLVRNASSVLTLASPGTPKRGAALGDLGEVRGASVAVRDGIVLAVGSEGEMSRLLDGDDVTVIDADGGLVMPGFVDPHTHLVFAGTRAEEFEARLVHGRDYLDFVTAGAGGLSTVARTRQTPTDELESLIGVRLRRLLEHGTTTAEVKTGYGLSVEEELRHVHALRAAAEASPIDVALTLLAAHFRPPEHRDDPEPWIEEIVDRLLPAVTGPRLVSGFDVFCEPGIYSIDQCRRLLMAAHGRGLARHVHADQLSASGGAELAVEVGARSADHLGHVSDAGITALAGSATVAVLIPGSVFFVPGEQVPPARRMIDAGVAIAVSSDYNPGSSPIVSQAMALSLATVLFHLSVAEAISAATINAAWAAGVHDRVGSLEAGKQADLLVLEASDHREIAYRFGENLVRQVIKKGRVVAGRPIVGPL
ncbi:MAG: imidazolonepropionase [Chloroflexota bacterium]|nr:imidazolonepropionase [Chloroflexota bacterium]